MVLPVLLPALLAAVGGQGAAGARHHAARLQGDPAPGTDLASRMIRFYITDKILNDLWSLVFKTSLNKLE